MILAIDTATRNAGIAVYDKSGVIAESVWRAFENHTTSLMPEVVRILSLAGVEIRNIRAVGVATGPGSFTGLRIGLSLAKGLALSLGVPIIGLPTLDGLAHALGQLRSPVWAVLELGRGRFAAALYVARNRGIQRTGEYFIGNAEQLAERIQSSLSLNRPPSQNTGLERKAENGKLVVCGEVSANLRSTLISRLPDRLTITSGALGAHRASYLAELAWLRFQTNELSDLESLTPFYVPTMSVPTQLAS